MAFDIVCVIPPSHPEGMWFLPDQGLPTQDSLRHDTRGPATLSTTSSEHALIKVMASGPVSLPFTLGGLAPPRQACPGSCRLGGDQHVNRETDSEQVVVIGRGGQTRSWGGAGLAASAPRLAGWKIFLEAPRPLWPLVSGHKGGWAQECLESAVGVTQRYPHGRFQVAAGGGDEGACGEAAMAVLGCQPPAHLALSGPEVRWAEAPRTWR